MSGWGRLHCSNEHGTLSVNSTSLSDPRWCFDDLSALLSEAEQRGGDRLIPGTASGVLARRRRRTVTRYDFPGVVTGWYTSTGTMTSNRAEGFLTNVAALRAALGIANDAPAGTAGTVAAAWDRPGALSTLNAAVHVVSLRVGKPVQNVAPVMLQLSVPSGVFA